MKTSTVQHIAKLASLPLTDDQLQQYTTQLTSVLTYVDQVQSLNTENVPETSQVTNLVNVLREDVVDDSQTFTQEAALQNAPESWNGFFVVPQILDQE